MTKTIKAALKSNCNQNRLHPLVSKIYKKPRTFVQFSSIFRIEYFLSAKKKYFRNCTILELWRKQTIFSS